MFEYQKTNKYFAQIAGSIEKYGAEELKSLNAQIISEVPRGVRFECQKDELYRILYTSRFTQRILAPLISMQCHSEKYLYQQANKNIKWTELFSVNETFTIITNVSNSHIKHSLYAGQILKDAICDQFKEKYGKRPSFKTKEGDIVFSLHINQNWASISMDISGKSLHKRGYRTQSNIAPMQETLAAVIIHLTQWDFSKPLIDLMCGSGTLLAEALMMYCNIPAGYLREDKSLKYMPDFDTELWESIKKEENEKIRPLPKGLLFGSDSDEQCISVAKENLKKLPYGENVVLQVKRFQDLEKKDNVIIVCNPPYGVRMGKTETINKLYNDLGDFLKQKTSASEAYILCGKDELVKQLRLRASWKKSLKNADIETKLAKVIIR